MTALEETTVRIDPDQEKIISDIAAGIAIYTAVLGLPAIGLGADAMAGVLVGGALTYFNFLWFASIIRKLITGESKPKIFAIKAALKIILMYGAVGLIVGFGVVNVVAFLVGISALFISVPVAALRWHGRHGKNDNDPRSE